jgi:hypothetical protein
MAGLCGCEPTTGDEIDSTEVGTAALTLRVVRYGEGTVGNAANGEHYKVFCKSTETVGRAYPYDLPAPLLMQQYYRVDSLKLGRVPAERVKVVDDQIAYGFIGGFFVTFDACKSVKYWNTDKLPKGFIKENATIVDPIISKVELGRDGYIALFLNPEALVNGIGAQVVSYNFGSNWQLIETH